MQFKRWSVNPPQKKLAAELAEECDVDAFVALIAAGRGYTDPVLLEEFLSDEIIMADPYELPDIENAAEIINNAVWAEEKIAIFGDYDVDGVTATVIMYDYLRRKGANVSYVIPDREKDGYGISMSAIDRLKNNGTELIITVDNGISAVAETDYAKSLGIKVVVTDHHLPSDELPCADAVVNPHLKNSNCEFKDVCGAFVAFKVICATEGSSPEELLGDYGALVALGTVADVMPLINENRTVVREGLNMIALGVNRGLTALLHIAGINEDQLTATRLAFGVAPRINAAGRMGDASRAAELLLTDDDEAANGIAEVLNNENIRRQALEKQIFNEAVNTVEKNGYKHNRVIVVSGEAWHGGVVGIVASRISEKYGKPTIVLSVTEGIANGSARSIKGFSIYDALCECSYVLNKFGGHEMAAGLTLYADEIDSFRRIINEYAMSFERQIPETVLDCKLNPAALSVDLADELKMLEPFGAGNPVPVFGIFGLSIKKITAVGAGKHLRIDFAKGEASFSAMLFGNSRSAFAYDVGDEVDIAVTLDTNLYGGNRSLTVSIKEIKKSGIDEKSVIDDISLYEAFKSGIFEDYTEIIPTREETGIIYKKISAKPASLDRLVCDNLAGIGYAKTLISAEALCELKLCTFFENDGVRFLRVSPQKEKVNLQDASVLKKLRGEL